MEVHECRGKRPSLIVKTWERCRSIRSPKTAAVEAAAGEIRRRRRAERAPEGCFSVYVGPQRQRFVVRTEYANHPLFRALLDEAESEFGFTTHGPLILPCDVALFHKFLVAMDEEGEMMGRLGCSGYGRLSPSKIWDTNLFRKKLY